MKRGAFSRGSAVSTLALAIAAIGVAAPASAQDAAPAAGTAEPAAAQEQDAAAQEQPAATGEEIIVTGSRLGRTSFNSPTPVNVIGQERAQDLNITNVGDALNQIPSFRPIAGPTTTQQRSSANIAGRSLDLRGLGAVRTLTLVDGRRHVASGDDGTFDLNAIPSIMVQRSEVVTGGASAAYGRRRGGRRGQPHPRYQAQRREERSELRHQRARRRAQGLCGVRGGHRLCRRARSHRRRRGIFEGRRGRIRQYPRLEPAVPRLHSQPLLQYQSRAQQTAAREHRDRQRQDVVHAVGHHPGREPAAGNAVRYQRQSGFRSSSATCTTRRSQAP